MTIWFRSLLSIACSLLRDSVVPAGQCLALPHYAARPGIGTNLNERRRSGRCDSEANLGEMIHDLAQFRIFTFDRDLMDRTYYNAPGHRVESVVVRGNGHFRSRLQSVRIIVVD